MILNLGSLAFNANIITGGGTPAWGTELGQGEGYKFAFEDMSDFFTGMVYSSVADIENVTCPLGKGGNARSDYEFVIASHFKKIYVNSRNIPNAQFILLVVKKLVGDYHVGRRTIKYNPRMTYKGKEINDDCYKKMAKTLGLNSDAAWFVHEINIQNQDELHFVAYELGKEPKEYSSNDERKKDFLSKLPKVGKKKLFEESVLVTDSIQRIIYGAPGTGKSHTIKEQTEGKSVIRTTFHPDSDYSTFVGAYKPSTAEQVKYGLQGQPILGNDGKPLKEQIITYKFVQQAFVKAYIAAWRNYPKPQYLVIEEINRGNCAQIFGDLFQLLDRNDEGFSEYSIAADEDLRKELKEQLENSDNEIKASYQKVFNGEELLLPNNLYIWATMNTSDQSLFPIDSAFKRRWEWKYVPICNANKGYYISVNGKKYDWWNFLEEINKKIEETTSSEDKKMGYFFCKAKDGCICADTFVGKVLFYIWNDVFKDYGFDDAIFKDAEGRVLKFQQFFKTDGSANEDMVERFLNNLKLSSVSDTASGDAKTTAAEEEDLSSEQ